MILSPDFALLGLGFIPLLFFLAMVILIIVGFWKTFEKAGQPGWGAIIPIFNLYCLCKIAGKSGWWVLLYFIPVVNIVISIIVTVEVARNFGKGVGFIIGLVLLPGIFYPILGFGSAVYQPLNPSAIPAA